MGSLNNPRRKIYSKKNLLRWLWKTQSSLWIQALKHSVAPSRLTTGVIAARKIFFGSAIGVVVEFRCYAVPCCAAFCSPTPWNWVDCQALQVKFGTNVSSGRYPLPTCAIHDLSKASAAIVCGCADCRIVFHCCHRSRARIQYKHPIVRQVNGLRHDVFFGRQPAKWPTFPLHSLILLRNHVTTRSCFMGHKKMFGSFHLPFCFQPFEVPSVQPCVLPRKGRAPPPQNNGKNAWNTY